METGSYKQLDKNKHQQADDKRGEALGREEHLAEEGDYHGYSRAAVMIESANKYKKMTTKRIGRNYTASNLLSSA